MRSLTHLLVSALTKRPGRTVLLDPHGSITAGDLLSAARGVTTVLQKNGVGEGHRVGLLLERGRDAAAATLGTLLCGASYLPLDTLGPAERVASVLAHASVRAVLTDRSLPALADPVTTTWNGHQFVLDRGNLGTLRPAQHGAEGFLSGTEEDAYVLHTSGSTGLPKGVRVGHSAATSFVTWAQEAFSLRPSDRVAWLAPLGFDLSVLELHAALWAGATVLAVPRKATVFPRDLLAFLERESVSVLYVVPTRLLRLAEVLEGPAPRLTSLRLALFAGEVCPPRPLAKLMAALPWTTFANLYGPTETNVCTCHVLSSPPLEVPPLGRPCPGQVVRVVDAHGRNVEHGEGELWVGGPTLMSGYLGDPEGTERCLVEDPVGTPPGHPRGRLYRTGDRVRRTESGALHFLGRDDCQLKRGGLRCEPGEIEAVLQRHPLVARALVELCAGELLAHVELLRPLPDPGRELRLHAREHLPAAMVPERVLVHAALPLLPNGKVDRLALRGHS